MKLKKVHAQDLFVAISNFFKEIKEMEQNMESFMKDPEFIDFIPQNKQNSEAGVVVYSKSNTTPSILFTPTLAQQQRDFIKIIALPNEMQLKVEYRKRGDCFVFPIRDEQQTQEFLDWLIINELKEVTPDLFIHHYSDLAAAVGGGEHCCGCE